MKGIYTFVSLLTIVTLLSVTAPLHVGAQVMVVPSGSMDRAIQEKIDRCTVRTRFMGIIESYQAIVGRGLCSTKSLHQYEDRVLNFIATCTLMENEHGLRILPEAFTADALYDLDDLLADCQDYLRRSIDQANALATAGQI